jgi:hypothetical protein
MILSWENSRAEFVPLLKFPVELRLIIYTTEYQRYRDQGHQVGAGFAGAGRPRLRLRPGGAAQVVEPILDRPDGEPREPLSDPFTPNGFGMTQSVPD